jgi:hypothetical protein
MKFQGKWQVNDSGFRKACMRLSTDLDNFKRDPEYRKIVGNDCRSREIAENFFNFLKDDPKFQNNINEFLVNDRIGNPFTYEIGGITISPGTLVFMKVLFDFAYLKPKSIIEIGSGYGGQCLITKKYFPKVDYTLIDIPDSLALAKAYLTANKIKANYISTEDLPDTFQADLCISNYCIGELDIEGIDFYIDNIISKCKYAYITSSHNQRLLIENRLRKYSNDVFPYDEFPSTSNQNIIIKCGFI